MTCCFFFSFPIINVNIYRLKDVVNVGFWQGNTYVKIHTPKVVAYHDNSEQLYLAPNLKMCTLTKNINFLCPSKPFVCDNTKGICSLESVKPDTSCPAEATSRFQVEPSSFGNSREKISWEVNGNSKGKQQTHPGAVSPRNQQNNSPRFQTDRAQTESIEEQETPPHFDSQKLIEMMMKEFFQRKEEDRKWEKKEKPDSA